MYDYQNSLSYQSTTLLHFLQENGSSTCDDGASSYGCAARQRQQQQRCAPYSIPTAPSTSAGKQRVDPGPSGIPAAHKRPRMLQLAITMANTSLEATLLHFEQACMAAPGSAAALAALDAAEASMAQTTRMTNIASVLAKRCMQDAAPPAGNCMAILQHTQQLGLQLSTHLGAQLQQPGFAAAAGAGAGVGTVSMHWMSGLMPFAQLMQQQMVQQQEDVEEGEEVSSSCRSSNTTEA